MHAWILSTVFLCQQAPQTDICIVRGASGTEKYEQVFKDSVRLWQHACESAEVSCQVIGTTKDSTQTDKDLFLQWLATRPQKNKLWVVFVGHGTFDGRDARFNLNGPDISARELKEALANSDQEVVLINGTSCSAPFLPALSSSQRVVITATKSGHEHNATQFNLLFAKSLNEPKADLDKDDQVSLLESFLYTSRMVAAFYSDQGRLATEQALLDDNGDGLGTPGEWFEGVYAVKKPQNDSSPDGRRANQIYLVPSERERNIPSQLRDQRDQLEREILALRDRKTSLEEDRYYELLEEKLVALAEVCEEIDKALERKLTRAKPKLSAE